MKTIMLVCNAGISTGVLVDKMQQQADIEGREVRVLAMPLNRALEKAEDMSVVLLSPQIAYAKADLERAAGGSPVQIISKADYAELDAKKILADAVELLG